MDNQTTADSADVITDNGGARKVLRGIRKFALEFLLPFLAIGPVLYGAETLAEMLGFHGTGAQFIRFIMLGVYGLIIFVVMKSANKR